MSVYSIAGFSVFESIKSTCVEEGSAALFYFILF